MNVCTNRGQLANINKYCLLVTGEIIVGVCTHEYFIVLSSNYLLYCCMNNKEEDRRKPRRTVFITCNHRHRASSFFRHSASCLRAAENLLRYPGILGPSS